jgi:hypothetical protein
MASITNLIIALIITIIGKPIRMPMVQAMNAIKIPTIKMLMAMDTVM